MFFKRIGVFLRHVFSFILTCFLEDFGGGGGSRLDMQIKQILLTIPSRPAIPFGGAAN